MVPPGTGGGVAVAVAAVVTLGAATAATAGVGGGAAKGSNSTCGAGTAADAAGGAAKGSSSPGAAGTGWGRAGVSTCVESACVHALKILTKKSHSVLNYSCKTCSGLVTGGTMAQAAQAVRQCVKSLVGALCETSVTGLCILKPPPSTHTHILYTRTTEMRAPHYSLLPPRPTTDLRGQGCVELCPNYFCIPSSLQWVAVGASSILRGLRASDAPRRRRLPVRKQGRQRGPCLDRRGTRRPSLPGCRSCGGERLWGSYVRRCTSVGAWEDTRRESGAPFDGRQHGVGAGAHDQ